MRSASLSTRQRRTFAAPASLRSSTGGISAEPTEVIGSGLSANRSFCSHPVFNRFHTETELLRYISRLESRDLSLTTSMIPLGSCTMKLNAAAEMFPVTWEKVAGIHPFVPIRQARGYHELFRQLKVGLRRSRALPRFPCSPMPAPRANTPASGDPRIPSIAWGAGRDVCLIPDLGAWHQSRERSDGGHAGCPGRLRFLR